MKLKLNKYCFSQTTEVDGLEVTNEKVKEVILKLLEFDSIDKLTILNTIIEYYGEETYSSTCEQCGDWNYTIEMEV